MTVELDKSQRHSLQVNFSVKIRIILSHLKNISILFVLNVLDQYKKNQGGEPFCTFQVDHHTDFGYYSLLNIFTLDHEKFHLCVHCFSPKILYFFYYSVLLLLYIIPWIFLILDHFYWLFTQPKSMDMHISELVSVYFCFALTQLQNK